MGRRRHQFVTEDPEISSAPEPAGKGLFIVVPSPFPDPVPSLRPYPGTKATGAC